MPTTKKYRCINFGGGCNRALGHEVLEIEDGQEAICPEVDCGSKLESVVPGKFRVPKWAYAAAAVVLLAIGIGSWITAPPKSKPNPDAAEKMLSDFYPQLPAK